MLKFQNLHSHTKNSDGKLSYLETLKICQDNQIGVVAFTDHDSLPSKKTVDSLLRNRHHPVKWVIGIEVTSGLPKELGGKPTSDFHIVSLFVDPFNRLLQKHCQKLQDSRVKRAQKMVKNLQTLGFQISLNECLREAKGQTINRPHLLSALLKHEKNLQKIDQIKEKMYQETNNNPKIKELYLKMIAHPEEKQPFLLFLSDQAYLKGIYVDYLYGLDLDSSVKLIRSAGGLAILAHWSFCKQKVNSEVVEKLIEEKRIDGLETVYGNSLISRKKEILADMKILKEICLKHHALQSGGADSHAKKDLIDFSKAKEFANQTIGMTQPLIDHLKIDQKTTSLILS